MTRGSEPSPRARALARGFESFAFRLAGRLPPERNTFFSPLSLSVALAALVPGSAGATRDEITGLLGISGPERIDEDVRALLDGLRPRSVRVQDWDQETGALTETEKEAFALRVANALFVQRGYPLREPYRAVMGKAFDAEVEPLDFAEPDAAAEAMNAWAAERTNDRIRDLVSSEDLTSDTRLVLANAIYFKAQWDARFEEHATEPEPFHLLPHDPRGEVDVPTMWQTNAYAYWRSPDGDVETLAIPYEAGIVMRVLLPRPGAFAPVVERVGPDLLARVRAHSEVTDVSLRLPRFRLRFGCRLAETLQALGVRAAFDADRADFTGITPDPLGLVLSDAIHQAFVDVDERGTEAAAATAMVAMAGAAPGPPPPPPVPFHVDRPFLFLIEDVATGAVLFLGRVVDPTAD